MHSFIKTLKLKNLLRLGISIDDFIEINESIKAKENKDSLVSFDSKISEDVLVSPKMEFMNLFFKNHENKFYSYYNFFENTQSNDLNIFNTSYFLNKDLSNEILEESIEKFNNLVKFAM